MEFLKQRYFDFVDELDPFRDPEEDPDNLSDMLYNLLEIKKDWAELEPDLMGILDATIQQFKAQGVEII